MKLNTLAREFSTAKNVCPICGCNQPEGNIENNHCYICKPDKSLSLRVECVHPAIYDEPKFAFIFVDTVQGIGANNTRYFDTLESLISELDSLGLRVNNNGAVSIKR